MVGGVKIIELVVDFVVLFVIYLLMCNKVLLKGLIVFGEVGLVGEIWLFLCG